MVISYRCFSNGYITIYINESLIHLFDFCVQFLLWKFDGMIIFWAYKTLRKFIPYCATILSHKLVCASSILATHTSLSFLCTSNELGCPSVDLFTFSHFIDWMYWDRSGPKIPGCLSVCVSVCLCACLSVCLRWYGETTGPISTKLSKMGSL